MVLIPKAEQWSGKRIKVHTRTFSFSFPSSDLCNQHFLTLHKQRRLKTFAIVFDPYCDAYNEIEKNENGACLLLCSLSAHKERSYMWREPEQSFILMLIRCKEKVLIYEAGDLWFYEGKKLFYEIGSLSVGKHEFSSRTMMFRNKTVTKLSR